MNGQKQEMAPADFRRMMNGLLFRGENGDVAAICQSLIGKGGGKLDALCHFFLAAALENIGSKRQADEHRRLAISLDPLLEGEKASPKNRVWVLSYEPMADDPMPEWGRP
ncbi:MAG: hypothetical protein WC861_05965 [Candidatus Micrarchaeia archaeon]|jgi:hypothetical protein